MFHQRPATLDPQLAYALWAENYPPRPHNPLMQAEQAAVEALLAQVSAASALDIGVGSGRYLPMLARTGARRIIGLDFSMPMLRRNPASDGLVCADAEALPFPGAAFDLALASLVVGHLRGLGRWTAEVRRALRPGGHLIYSDFHPAGAAKGWRRTFTAADGRTFAVRHFRHSLAAHRAALRAHGFSLREVLEPRLRPEYGPEAEAFRRRWGDAPVVVVLHAVRAAG